MRPIRDVDEQENARIEQVGGFSTIKRDPVKPEPEGTIVLLPFRITGYDPDCDGSLMAQLEGVHVWQGRLESSGLGINRIGLYPTSGIVVTEDELLDMLPDPPEVEEVE